MIEVTLKAKTVTENGLEFIRVKDGKKKVADIFSPNKFHEGTYQIELNKLVFYRPTLVSALEFVRQKIEDSFNAFEAGKYSFKMEAI